MATTVDSVLSRVRILLVEPTARFWSDAELIDHINAGVKDLWRSIADLKQEHFLLINEDVVFPSNSSALTNVPTDVHKVVMIEAMDTSENGSNPGLHFQPLEYNHERFQFARARAAISPANDTLYYDIHGAGGPTGVAPIVRVAPSVTADVHVAFAYVPVLQPLTVGSVIPIPGEADHALAAWTVSYARAKETDTRSPDPGWLGVYATEKANILESLGLRQYQEPKFTDALFEDYWG
jgi:hypothetical protein